jgi:hypothetical protein
LVWTVSGTAWLSSVAGRMNRCPSAVTAYDWNDQERNASGARNKRTGAPASNVVAEMETGAAAI